MATEDIPAALDVTLSIPMDQLLGAYTERASAYYSNDPDAFVEEPPIVLDAIGERVAQMLLARFEADARKAVQSKLARAQVTQRLKEKAAEAIAATVASMGGVAR